MELRAELWARVYAGIASSPAGREEAAVRWADNAVASFDFRFQSGISRDDEERAIIEMLALSGEVSKQSGEPSTTYVRRLLDEICRLRAERLRQ